MQAGRSGGMIWQSQVREGMEQSDHKAYAPDAPDTRARCAHGQKSAYAEKTLSCPHASPGLEANGMPELESGAPQFPATRWSVVLAASGGGTGIPRPRRFA
jgi:hypothetical protein